jgi:octanoyl-[GcvH]:protein N-octanoyltransferase
VLLLRDAPGARASLDMAVSAALLQRVAAGELEPVLRLQRHRPAVAFGRLDALEPGYRAALEAARERGFEPFERLAGGRAAVYHERVLTIGEVLPDEQAAIHIERRYAATAQRIADALATLGVDAHVGAVAGEYCPGDFSVNARGVRKLSGTAQRVVRGGAYVGTVLVVDDGARIADVVRAIYAALCLDVDPSATGAVADEAPGIDVDAVEAALIAAYGTHASLRPWQLDARTIQLAHAAEARFRAPAAARR